MWAGQRNVKRDALLSRRHWSSRPHGPPCGSRSGRGSGVRRRAIGPDCAPAFVESSSPAAAIAFHGGCCTNRSTNRCIKRSWDNMYEGGPACPVGGATRLTVASRHAQLPLLMYIPVSLGLRNSLHGNPQRRSGGGRIPGGSVGIAGIPFNATLWFFGTTELVGHLPVYGAMLVLLVYGSDPALRPAVSSLWPFGRRPLERLRATLAAGLA